MMFVVNSSDGTMYSLPETFADLCRDLKANESYLKRFDTSLYIKKDDMDDEVAVKLGEALQDNTVVTGLTLSIGSMTVDGVRCGITQFISRNPSLRNLVLDTKKDGDIDRDVANQLLAAMAASPGVIEGLDLTWLPSNFGIPQFSSAMDGLRASLKKLLLSFSLRMDNDSADVVASSVCNLNCLECLEINDESPDCSFAIATINRLVDHPRLQELLVDFSSDSADGQSCSGALHNLLVSSTPLSALSLHYSMENHCFSTELLASSTTLSTLSLHYSMENRRFSTVLPRLHSAGSHNNNTTLRQLKLCLPKEASDGDAADITTMLRNNQALQVLVIDSIGAQQFATIMEALAGDNQTLQKLDVTDSSFYDDDDDNGDDHGVQIEQMANAIDRIAGLLPRLTHLRAFRWYVDDDSYPIHELPGMTGFVGGFEQNFSLTNVDVDLFSRDQYRLIENYTTRNAEYLRFKEAASNATKTGMLVTVFPQVQTSNLDEAIVLSVVWETLRSRNDWNPSSLNARTLPTNNQRRQMYRHMMILTVAVSLLTAFLFLYQNAGYSIGRLGGETSSNECHLSVAPPKATMKHDGTTTTTVNCE